ncbi:MAG: bacillithiol biosynthesis cysteine-adding enzyme BshC, partial [Bacteroidota bacterium]
LADGVLADLTRWDAPPAAIAAARELGNDAVYAVVTGQQAGIATGPLYTMYKALGAIRAAEKLSALYPGKRFVPVFWIEGDDHDFDEARSITLLDRGGNPAHLQYDDGDSRPLHVGDRAASADGIAALAASLREILPPTDFTEQALAVLESAYGSGAGTIADGFARALYMILGDLPLVLVSSRNPALKRLAADIFAREAADPRPLFDALTDRTEALKSAGVPTPITPKSGALFITHEGERRSLDPVDGGYDIRGTGQHLSFDQAVALAHAEPERCSPNVALRPIVQDAILPTALYLGGPSEVAYLNQIAALYPLFGIEPPLIAPRPFVMLLEPKVRRALELAGITLERLLAADFSAADLLVDKEAEHELHEASARALEAVHAAFAGMESITRQIDPTMEKALGSATAGGTKGIEDLTKRLGSALRKKQQTEIDRLNGARGMVLPEGKLQERLLNAIYFINKYGMEKFRAALGEIGIDEEGMQVMEL